MSIETFLSILKTRTAAHVRLITCSFIPLSLSHNLPLMSFLQPTWPSARLRLGGNPGQSFLKIQSQLNICALYICLSSLRRKTQSPNLRQIFDDSTKFDNSQTVLWPSTWSTAKLDSRKLCAVQVWLWEFCLEEKYLSGEERNMLNMYNWNFMQNAKTSFHVIMILIITGRCDDGN